MQNRGQVIFGGIIILVGTILLLGNFFNTNLWPYLWPALLIFLGAYLLLRPSRSRAADSFDVHPFGNVKRFGEWEVTDEELLLFAGDMHLDFTRAQIPDGETEFRVTGFAGDVDFLVPDGLGFQLVSNGFAGTTTINGHKNDRLITSFEYRSDNFNTAAKKLLLRTTFFAGDITLDTVGLSTSEPQVSVE